MIHTRNMTPAPHDIYRAHMLDAKLRLVAAEKLSSSPEPLTGLPALDLEFCFLQIRRVVEAITFAGMAREGARYEKYREQQHQDDPKKYHGDPTQDWNATEILKCLVRLSPHVLPIPVKEATPVSVGLWHYDRQQINVNHGRLIDLYGQCGGYLHGKNPLRGGDFVALNEAERKKYRKAPAEVRRALVFLRKLLWRHAAVTLEWSDSSDPISPDSPSSVWIVDFGAEGTPDVTLIVGEAI